MSAPDSTDVSVVQEAIRDLGNTMTRTPALLSATQKVEDRSIAKTVAWGTLATIGWAGTVVCPGAGALGFVAVELMAAFNAGFNARTNWDMKDCESSHRVARWSLSAPNN